MGREAGGRGVRRGRRRRRRKFPICVKELVINPLWAAAMLSPTTSIITYLSRAWVPLTILRFCDYLSLKSGFVHRFYCNSPKVLPFFFPRVGGLFTNYHCNSPKVFWFFFPYIRGAFTNFYCNSPKVFRFFFPQICYSFTEFHCS